MSGLILQINQSTLLKRRPADPTLLGFHEKVAAGFNQVYLQSYADGMPMGPGHWQIELVHPCHGETVWYIEQLHCQIYQGQIQNSMPTMPSSVPASISMPLNHSASPANGASSAGATDRINTAGLELVKHFEGLRLEAYRCPAGVPTIGYGSTAGVQMGDKLTEPEAEALLLKDLQKFEEAVRDLVQVPLTANQFSALVCFTFNVGEGALAESTLLKKLNQQDYQDAADQFLRWNKAGGQELPGLTTRREAERKLFLTP